MTPFEPFHSSSLGVIENSPTGDWERISGAAQQCKELQYLSCKQISDSVAGILLGDVTAHPYSPGVVI